MQTRKPKHVHKYRKIKIGRNKDYIVYACALPDCNHYLPPEQVVGKLTVCWRCGELCQIRKDNRGNILAKPHCIQCTSEPRNPAFRKKPIKDVKTKASTLAQLLLGNIPPDA